MKKLFNLLLLASLSLAAMAQTADALYEEGKTLYDAKSYAAAFPKLKQAAEQGHKKAQYRVGRCYDKGYGVKEDDKQAFQWYLKAAEQGHAKAQYEVGDAYEDGEGTKRDLKLAFQYFTLSAMQGNAEAQIKLSECYLEGKGTKADKAKAQEWAKKAVANPKDGNKIMNELREEAADQDREAKALLKLIEQ